MPPTPHPMMTRIRTIVRAALLAGAALTMAPDAAHAQFGGLRKRLEDRMLGQGTTAQRAPTFDDRVLEITDARLEQLLRGLKAEQAAVARQEQANAAENARAAEYEKKQEAYGKCAEPYTKELLRYTGMTMGLAFAAKREQDKTGKVGGPMQDSLKAVTDRMVKVKDGMVAKCGEGPGEAPFDAMGGEGSDPEAMGAKAAGLKSEQYAVLRERAAAFLLARGGRTGSYVYVAGERTALERRSGDLAAFRKLLGE